jgi:hypothetical protein
MLADDIADRIVVAYEDELRSIFKDMWGKHADGLLTENELETLEEAARARKEALQARLTETPLFCLTALADLHLVAGDTLGWLHWLEVVVRSGSTHDKGRHHT